MEVKYKSMKKERAAYQWTGQNHSEPTEDRWKTLQKTDYTRVTFADVQKKEFSLWFNKATAIEGAGERWKGDGNKNAKGKSSKRKINSEMWFAEQSMFERSTRGSFYNEDLIKGDLRKLSDYKKLSQIKNAFTKN